MAVLQPPVLHGLGQRIIVMSMLVIFNQIQGLICMVNHTLHWIQYTQIQLFSWKTTSHKDHLKVCLPNQECIPVPFSGSVWPLHLLKRQNQA